MFGHDLVWPHHKSRGYSVFRGSAYLFSVALALSLTGTGCGGDGTTEPTDDPADAGRGDSGREPTVTQGPTGRINTPAGGTIGSVTAPLSVVQFAAQFSAPLGRPAAPPDTIAYMVRGESELSIRLIDSNGNNDRPVISIRPEPSSASAPNALFDTVIFDELRWRPDGTEIAFTSNFEVSAYRTEIYATTIDGSNLRRLTGVPRPIAYPNYPSGLVTLSAVHPELSGGISIAYLEGSQQGYGWLAALGDELPIQFHTADLGNGVIQKALLLSAGNCYYDDAANVDVIAGQTVNVRQALPPTTLAAELQCPLRYSPQWLDNDRLIYVERDHVGPQTAVNFAPAFSVRSTPVENLSPTTGAQELARYSEFDRRADTLLDVVEGENNEFLFVRLDRTENSDAFVTFNIVSSPLLINEDRAFVGSLSAPASGNLVRQTLCPDAIGCDLADVEWLPEEDAVAYSSIDDADRSSLRLLSNIDGVVTHETLTQVTDGQLGTLAVSPDGQRILVERTFSRSTIPELWMFDRRDDTFSQFVDNGVAPAWR